MKKQKSSSLSSSSSLCFFPSGSLHLTFSTSSFPFPILKTTFLFIPNNFRLNSEQKQGTETRTRNTSLTLSALCRRRLLLRLLLLPNPADAATAAAAPTACCCCCCSRRHRVACRVLLLLRLLFVRRRRRDRGGGSSGGRLALLPLRPHRRRRAAGQRGAARAVGDGGDVVRADLVRPLLSFFLFFRY